MGEEIKTGRQTTELALAIAASGLGVVALLAGLVLVVQGQHLVGAILGVTGPLSASAASIGYSMSRGRVKAASASTIVVASSKIV
jgi:hypothetical protein